MFDINQLDVAANILFSAKICCYGLAGILAGRRVIQLTPLLSYAAVSRIATALHKTEVSQKLNTKSVSHFNLLKQHLIRDLTIAAGIAFIGYQIPSAPVQEPTPSAMATNAPSSVTNAISCPINEPIPLVIVDPLPHINNPSTQAKRQFRQTVTAIYLLDLFLPQIIQGIKFIVDTVGAILIHSANPHPPRRQF